MFDAILLLAGNAKRSNLEYNKVFYPLKGKPLFLYSLETFQACQDCRKVILVCHKDEIDRVKEKLSDYSNLDFVVGGKHRQDSVKAGMACVETQIALIHDGARPFVRLKDIENVYRATETNGAAVLAVPTIDTIVQVKENYQPLDRNTLWNVLTPQGVKTELYQKALELAENEGYYCTDDLSLLVKYLKIKPEIIEGDYTNIKLTNASDFDYLEYLSRRNG